MGLRQFTVADALEALRQNNIPHATGSLTQGTNNRRTVTGTAVIGSACALGQCAINLGVEAGTLQAQLHTIKLKKGGYAGETLSARIINLNDTYRYTPDKVARIIEDELTVEQLNVTLQAPTTFWINVLKSA